MYMTALVQAETMVGQQAHHKSKCGEQDNKVDNRCSIPLRRQIASEKSLIYGPNRHQEKQVLVKEQPKGQCGHQQNETLCLAQGQGSVSPVQHPDWNEVEQ